MTRSLFETLAPLMIVGIEGPRLTRRERALLAQAPPAGIILFARNVESARQLRRLTGELEKVFIRAKGKPPIIAADHEGAVVSVLADAIGTPPSQMAAGQAGDPSLVGRLFAETARRMLACGVNLMLGPVADINSEQLNPIIGTRSFGEDVATVSRCVAAAVAGARKAGILTCLKHFPGHGPTRADSHLTLSILGATLDMLKREDLVPFIRGFEAEAESVMVGHVVPKGRSLSASLDPEIVTGVLRNELHFDGVAMTDALEMAGIRTVERRSEAEASAAEQVAAPRRPLAETCRLALRAGNDVLLFSKAVGEIFDELGSSAVAEIGGEFRDAELAACTKKSSGRIDRFNDLIALELIRPGRRRLDDAPYRQVAARSVRIVRGPDSFVPVSRRAGFNVVFWTEKGMFERPPVRSFVARVLEGLAYDEKSPRGGGVQGPEQSLLETPGYAQEHRNKISGKCPDLDSAAYSIGGGADATEIAFLMNRKPLEPAIVREICSSASVVVVAEWPYASPSIDPGKTVIVTYGIYGAAAEFVCSLLLGGPGRASRRGAKTR